MTDFDIHPDGLSIEDLPVHSTPPKDPRLSRDAQKDLHLAIDIAYAFASQLKELHPLAEKQIKGMIFQGNLI